MMKKKDLVNEYIGIISIIVIVVLAIVGIYFYLEQQPPHERKDMNNTTISLNQPTIHSSTLI